MSGTWGPWLVGNSISFPAHWWFWGCSLEPASQSPSPGAGGLAAGLGAQVLADFQGQPRVRGQRDWGLW